MLIHGLLEVPFSRVALCSRRYLPKQILSFEEKDF